MHWGGGCHTKACTCIHVDVWAQDWIDINLVWNDYIRCVICVQGPNSLCSLVIYSCVGIMNVRENVKGKGEIIKLIMMLARVCILILL